MAQRSTHTFELEFFWETVSYCHWKLGSIKCVCQYAIFFQPNLFPVDLQADSTVILEIYFYQFKVDEQIVGYFRIKPLKGCMKQHLKDIITKKQKMNLTGGKYDILSGKTSALLQGKGRFNVVLKANGNILKYI